MFKEEIFDKGVEFTSVRGAYDLYGTGNLFMVKKYSTVNLTNFQNFRRRFYETLNASLGAGVGVGVGAGAGAGAGTPIGTPIYTTVQKGTNPDIETFRIYSYVTKELCDVSV
jgi:hypothetical protein